MIESGQAERPSWRPFCGPADLHDGDVQEWLDTGRDSELQPA
jgi:hypothetical protein